MSEEIGVQMNQQTDLVARALKILGVELTTTSETTLEDRVEIQSVRACTDAENTNLKPSLTPGALITWVSPLFGLCRGKVGFVDGDMILIEDHPVTHGYYGPAWIPQDWLINN